LHHASIDVLYVSDVYVDDANTETNDAYTVSNVRLGYDYAWQHWLFGPFFGIQNLFDATYNANVRINAFGGRYFEPAPKRNIYGGITVAYNW
jgi:iron complex outermembrane recepter protein